MIEKRKIEIIITDDSTKIKMHAGLKDCLDAIAELILIARKLNCDEKIINFATNILPEIKALEEKEKECKELMITLNDEAK